ncbi:MAG: hypothetical protein KDH90_25525 [Anaerolineae bacterium]|nr:hypothetical protein [Anaerolineae bacterium]
MIASENAVGNRKRTIATYCSTTDFREVLGEIAVAHDGRCTPTATNGSAAAFIVGSTTITGETAVINDGRPPIIIEDAAAVDCAVAGKFAVAHSHYATAVEDATS